MGRRVKARGWKGGGAMSGRHRFPYRWTLRDARFTRDKGKVFSCFSCGGGSTMGYKLAGFDVVGCCEIDPRMAAVYEANHRPVRISRAELTLGSSFPLDFDFGSSSPAYICGMSVPPVMMAQVAARVYERLLAKIAGDRHVSGGERQA